MGFRTHDLCMACEAVGAIGKHIDNRREANQATFSVGTSTASQMLPAPPTRSPSRAREPCHATWVVDL